MMTFWVFFPSKRNQHPLCPPPTGEGAPGEGMAGKKAPESSYRRLWRSIWRRLLAVGSQL